MASAIFRDETATGRALSEFSLPGLPDRVSARELVRTRVREEVARHHASPSRPFHLDTEIDLTAEPVISFVKLVPLVGG